MSWLRRRTPKPPARRPDPLRIAELEYELFGIEPRPGSAAAFALGLQRVFGTAEPAAIVTLPSHMSRREAAEFAAAYAHTAVNSQPFVLAHGGVETIYQHPSARTEETT